MDFACKSGVGIDNMLHAILGFYMISVSVESHYNLYCRNVNGYRCEPVFKKRKKSHWFCKSVFTTRKQALNEVLRML